MTRLYRPLLVAAFVVAAIVVGQMLGALLPIAAPGTQVGSSVTRPGVMDAMQRISTLSPYRVWLPSFTQGTRVIENAEWDAAGEGRFSFDIWYRLPDGTRVHLWESNIADLRDKDPTVGGTRSVIGGRNWTLVVLTDSIARYSLSTRTAGGVIVSLDTASSDAVLLESEAASLASE